MQFYPTLLPGYLRTRRLKQGESKRLEQLKSCLSQSPVLILKLSKEGRHLLEKRLCQKLREIEEVRLIE